MVDLPETPHSINLVNYDQVDDLEIILRQIIISDDDFTDKAITGSKISADEEHLSSETSTKEAKNSCKSKIFVLNTNRQGDFKVDSPTPKEKRRETNNPVMADWEKHSNGVAGKLMKKMGFQPGLGLGKDLQGISKPIEAVSRKGRGAIGFYGPEQELIRNSSAQNAKNYTKIQAEGDKKCPIPNSNPGNGMKKASSTKPMNLIKPGDAKLTRDIKSQVKEVELAQSEQDPMDALEFQLKNLKIEKDKLKEVKKCLKECREACLDVPLVDALDICSDLLKNLKSHRNDRVIYEKITDKITKIIRGAVEEEFLHWDAIAEAKVGARLMALTREVLLLVPRPLHEKEEVMLGLFDDIIWEIIMPKVKESIDLWDATRPKELLELFDWWEPLFDQDMVSDIIGNHLHIRLESALLKWNPICDTASPDQWVRPWIPMLGSRTRTFYPVVIQKLTEVLVSLEAEEFDYKMLMKSGLSILDERSRITFIVEQVIPILARHLRGIKFSLDVQDVDQLKRVTDWAEWIPQKFVAKCLVENFFPKMVRALLVRVETFPMSELSLWLMQWLNCIPEKVKSDRALGQCIGDALVVIEYGMNLSAKSKV